jgi:aspartokinase/homoserine dehydrogenase 1
VTDALLRPVAPAERQDGTYRSELAQLRSRHAAIAQEVLTPQSAQAYLAIFDRDCQDLLGILHAVELTRSAANTVSDLIAGYGEIWSSRLFQRFFEERRGRPGPVQWVDASRVVLVDWGAWGPGIQWTESRASLAAQVPKDFTGTLIITGFIAADRRGVRTTLGRNGSDFSASIFAALLDASEIHIWTDVDGVLSVTRAACRMRPSSTRLLQRGDGAGYFGAWGSTRRPCRRSRTVSRSDPQYPRPGCRHPDLRPAGLGVAGEGIPDRARGADQPRGHRHDRCPHPRTGFRWRCARRASRSSSSRRGSSEHSICCAIPQEEAERAAACVLRAFERELADGQIQASTSIRPAILAVVAMAWPETRGSRRRCSAPRCRRRQRAGDRSAPERNISAVVEGRAIQRCAVHAGFHLLTAHARSGSSDPAPWAACCSASPRRASGCASRPNPTTRARLAEFPAHAAR